MFRVKKRLFRKDIIVNQDGYTVDISLAVDVINRLVNDIQSYEKELQTAHDHISELLMNQK